MKSSLNKPYYLSNNMYCCSYVEADPVGKYLICATDALINIVLLAISAVYVQGVLQDVCIIHIVISCLTLLLLSILGVALYQNKRRLVLPWWGWTWLRVAFYALGPCILGIQSQGVPRIRGDAGIFFLFVMPFILAAMYGHFVWVVKCLYSAMPDPAKEAAAKKAVRESKRRKLSETTRRGIVALCLAPGLPNTAIVNAAVTGDDGKPVVATTNV